MHEHQEDPSQVPAERGLFHLYLAMHGFIEDLNLHILCSAVTFPPSASAYILSLSLNLNEYGNIRRDSFLNIFDDTLQQHKSYVMAIPP